MYRAPAERAGQYVASTTPSTAARLSTGTSSEARLLVRAEARAPASAVPGWRAVPGCSFGIDGVRPFGRDDTILPEGYRCRSRAAERSRSCAGGRTYFLYPTAWMFFMMSRSVAF